MVPCFESPVVLPSHLTRRMSEGSSTSSSAISSRNSTSTISDDDLGTAPRHWTPPRTDDGSPEKQIKAQRDPRSTVIGSRGGSTGHAKAISTRQKQQSCWNASSSLARLFGGRSCGPKLCFAADSDLQVSECLSRKNPVMQTNFFFSTGFSLVNVNLRSHSEFRRLMIVIVYPEYTPVNKPYDDIWWVNPQQRTFYGPPDGGGVGCDFIENTCILDTAVNLWASMKRSLQSQGPEHPGAQNSLGFQAIGNRTVEGQDMPFIEASTFVKWLGVAPSRVLSSGSPPWNAFLCFHHPCISGLRQRDSIVN